MLYVSDAAKVTVSITPNTVDHAHAYSEEEAQTLNEATSGVTFDYDGNTAQNDATDVQHHVTEGTLPAGQEVAPSMNLGKGAESFETNKEKEVVANVIYNAEAREINVIRVNDKYFKNIKDAFEKVDSRFGVGYLVSGDCVIEVLKDISDDGWAIASGSNVTVDFNGHTWDIDGTVGSSGTTTNGLQLLKDSTITFKNGTLTSSTAKKIIQNYANLTLENIFLDGSNLDVSTKVAYTLSNNNGTIIIKDTTITAKEGHIAFDVYNWIGGGYQSIDVTVQGNSKVVGTIEVGGNGTFNPDVNTFKLSLLGGDFSEAILDKQTGSNNATITISEGVAITVKAAD